MLIKGLTDEDFVNYKVPSFFIVTAKCSFKCDLDCGRQVCQNSELAKAKAYNINTEVLVSRYIRNEITKAIVFGGLEPMDQFDDLIAFLLVLRYDCKNNDDVVIYTGYTKEELIAAGQIDILKKFDNIVIKYGRFIPDQQPHLDPVLGVNLASDNQFAERIS